MFVGYVGATVFMADSLRDKKIAAIARHEARIDRNMMEAGQTAVETRKFNIGREPENIVVTAGIYVDRIFDVKLQNSSWKVDF